jgi:hypothetical protein
MVAGRQAGGSGPSPPNPEGCKRGCVIGPAEVSQGRLPGTVMWTSCSPPCPVTSPPPQLLVSYQSHSLNNHLLHSSSSANIASDNSWLFRSFASTSSLPLSFPPKPPKMKGALLTAAVLLGSAQAATHKMKLKKVPLAEQLVCTSLKTGVACVC